MHYFAVIDTNVVVSALYRWDSYEVTLDARQSDEAYLVTGNTKDFPRKPFVVTPREMLDIIEKGN